MALIACGECGRAVSNKAAACVGCGAPLKAVVQDFDSNGVFVIEPLRSKGPALTRRALVWRLFFAAATFSVGLIMTVQVEHRGGNHTAATVAALLLISGLCWLIVAILQNVMAHRRR